MKRFSELNIRQEENDTIFNCKQVSISDIINREIVIKNVVKDIKTKHGDGRYLIHYEDMEDNSEGKFFTNSERNKSALDQVDASDYPFIATVKAIKYGNGKLYQLT